jgi:ABC-type branched-subunit amino acid transport system ATPase component/ABC-type branched-subunit amino acid transport system permease subunit
VTTVAMAHVSLPLPALTLGLITGMTYGILAVGLVLIYRSNRVINFAHGEIGAFGAALLGLAVVRWHVPYWLAFIAVLGVSAGVGATTEAVVIRRLRHAPKIMSVVATLGVAQFLLLFSVVINRGVSAGHNFPNPAGLPHFAIGVLQMTPAYFAMLFFTPLVVVALAVFLRRSRYGVGIRAAAANPDAAEMAGISSSRMSTLSWAIAGAVSAYTAVLLFPTRGFVSYETLGPSILMRALAAAVIARMTSLPIALGAGIAVGVLEETLLWNVPQGGTVEAVLFVAILIALLFQRRQGARESEKGAWASVQPWPPLPMQVRQLWLVRNLGRIAFSALALVGVGLAALVTNSAAVTLTTILAFSLVAMSVGVITGLGGQLSLGQFALAGVGAFASQWVAARTGDYPVAFLCGGLAAGVGSVLIGLPALRIRGLMLAVTTLSFALAAQAWLFQQSWWFGSGVTPGRPSIGSLHFDTGRSYYVMALVVTAIGVWLARNVWTGGLGLRLRALRDNEDAARAFTVPATLVKLQAFMLAGFLAGLGGALFGHSLSILEASGFEVRPSIDSAAMAVIGGLGLLAGPILGALYMIGIPNFVPLDAAGAATQAFGWLLLVMYFPGGIAQLFQPVRTALIRVVASRAGLSLDAAPPDAERPAAVRLEPRAAGRRVRPDVLLSVRGVTGRFGGLTAVDAVSFDVYAGETLGLIGPNGAGKTTLFDLLSGFITPDEGSIIYTGKDITRWGPEAHGRAGIIRSFQDAALFPTLTVQETVAVSLERLEPTPFLPSLAGVRGPERRKTAQAADILDLLGLARYRDVQVAALSTGTRHIAEIACLLALQPNLLLLDEPSSGIAQRETEALADLLVNVRDQLDTTLVLIEHDMPLIMGLSDRIVAMDAGQVVAIGSPQGVRSNPIVVESYLGGNLAAIERSGTVSSMPPNADQRCGMPTRTGSPCSRRATVGGRCSQHATKGVRESRLTSTARA